MDMVEFASKALGKGLMPSQVEVLVEIEKAHRAGRTFMLAGGRRVGRNSMQRVLAELRAEAAKS